MGKAPDAFRTISEVADWLGVQTHVLRFWESKFTQVKPLKRAGGRRYYRPADMELLGGIRKLLHEDGLTIKGAQKFIRENGVKAVADLSPPVDGSEAVDVPASGVEAAAAMVPEAGAEVHVHPAVEAEEASDPAVDEAFDTAVSMEGEEPAPAAEVHISRDGPEAAVDMTGEEPAPAVEPEPTMFDSADSTEAEEPAPAAVVDVTGEEPAPAVEPEPTVFDSAVSMEGEAPAPAAEVFGEEGPAPEQKSNFFRDAPEDASDDEPEDAPEDRPEDLAEAAPTGGAQDDDLKLPSFIRKPMEGRETTVPPVTPGPLPLTETAEAESRFAGVGAAQMPDRADEGDQAGETVAEAPAPEPVDFSAAVTPDADMPVPQRLTATPSAALDAAQLRPLYDRLLALRARMG